MSTFPFNSEAYFEHFVGHSLKPSNPHWLFADGVSAPNYVPLHKKPAALQTMPREQRAKAGQQLADFMDPSKGITYGVGVCGARGVNAGAQVTSGMPLDWIFMLIAAKKIQTMSTNNGAQKPVICFLGDEIAKGNDAVARCQDTQQHIDVVTQFYRNAIDKIANVMGVKNHTVVSGDDYRHDPLYRQALKVAFAMSADELGVPDFSGNGDTAYYQQQVATVWYLRRTYGFNVKVSWYVGSDSIDETSFDRAQHFFDARMNAVEPSHHMNHLHFVATRPGFSWHRGRAGQAQVNVSPYYALDHQGGAASRFMLWPEQSVLETFLPLVAEDGCYTTFTGTRIRNDGKEITIKPSDQQGVPNNRILQGGFQLMDNLVHYLDSEMPNAGFAKPANDKIVKDVLASYKLGPEFARVAELCLRLDNGLRQTFAPLLAAAAAEVGPHLNDSFGFSPGQRAAGFTPTTAPANDRGHGAPDQRRVGQGLVLA